MKNENKVFVIHKHIGKDEKLEWYWEFGDKKSEFFSSQDEVVLNLKKYRTENRLANNWNYDDKDDDDRDQNLGKSPNPSRKLLLKDSKSELVHELRLLGRKRNDCQLGCIEEIQPQNINYPIIIFQGFSLSANASSRTIAFPSIAGTPNHWWLDVCIQFPDGGPTINKVAYKAFNHRGICMTPYSAQTNLSYSEPNNIIDEVKILHPTCS